MKYRLVNNVFHEGETHFAGEVLEIKDAELAKAYLERGSIVDAKDAPKEDQKEPAAEEVSENLEPSEAEVEQTLKEVEPSQDIEVK